jgi:hypothetical protein
MQTFLPYPSILLSINCLDNKRLGKQRVEAFQILKIIEGRATSNAWKNHPAVKMWSGYSEALKLYYNYCIDEWVGRGFKNTMQKYDVDFANFRMPSWWGDEKFHASHRSNLLRKNPEWYSQFSWTESSDLLYVWPGAMNK